MLQVDDRKMISGLLDSKQPLQVLVLMWSFYFNIRTVTLQNVFLQDRVGLWGPQILTNLITNLSVQERSSSRSRNRYSALIWFFLSIQSNYFNNLWCIFISTEYSIKALYSKTDEFSDQDFYLLFAVVIIFQSLFFKFQFNDPIL